MVAGTGSWVEVAQPLCDDVVVAAGYFKPNAPGRGGFSSIRALSERQFLKARAAYLAERVLIAVTPLEVVAASVGGAAPARVHRLVWNRTELRVRRIPCRTDDDAFPALCLSGPDGRPRLEVAPLVHEGGASVVDRLIEGGC